MFSSQVLHLKKIKIQLSTASHDTSQNSSVTTLVFNKCACVVVLGVFLECWTLFKQNLLVDKSAKCLQLHPVHTITVGVMHTSLSLCVFSVYTNGSTGISCCHNLLPCLRFNHMYHSCACMRSRAKHLVLSVCMCIMGSR